MLSNPPSMRGELLLPQRSVVFSSTQIQSNAPNKPARDSWCPPVACSALMRCAVRATAEGTIHSVKLLTRKPPLSLHDAPVLQEKGIDPKSLSEPVQVFSGSARYAIDTFPVGLNIAIALSLAGIGPDKTMLEVWLDPGVTRNIHKVDVESDCATFTMTMESEPAEDNPHSAKIAALSLLATLRGLTATMKVGT
jgi:aspartate dehydrogenase